MAEWQPIETAPRDGTVVLVSALYAVSTARGETYWVSVAEWGELGDREIGWIERTDDSSFLLPTHWMPLPSPPADAGAE